MNRSLLQPDRSSSHVLRIRNGKENSLFDFTHDYEVWKARKDQGLPYERQKQISHPLVGRYLIDQDAQKRYLIEKAYEEWALGWYLKLLIQHDNSHTVVYWESRNKLNPEFDDYVERDNKEYKLEE